MNLTKPPPAIFLADYRAAYVDIAKVASTSIKTFLAGVLGVSLDLTRGNPHRVRFPTVEVEGLSPGVLVFAFVRNPWDRLVSCFRDKVGGEPSDFTSFNVRPGVADCLARFESIVASMSFEQFVRGVSGIPDDEADEHFRSQHAFLPAAEQLTVELVIGRYETLAQDFERVRRLVGFPELPLPRVQAAPTKTDYRTYYTPETRAAIAARYRQDSEQFAYEF